MVSLNNPKSRYILAPLLGLMLTVSGVGRVEAAKAPSKIDPEASCSTADCHAGMLKRKFLHSPVEDNDCQGCHEPKGNRHAFDMEKPPDLCTGCHETLEEAGPVVHLPVEKDCTSCHDPHGSEMKGFFQAKDIKQLCIFCHDDLIGKDHEVHPPVDDGDCLECHKPHSSKHKKLLTQPQETLCLECHDDKLPEKGAPGVVHPPAEEDCMNCHNPHSGPKPLMMEETVGETCAGCHDEIAEAATEAKFPHKPAMGEEACVGCHDPHFTQHPKMLKAEGLELCIGCHNSEMETEDESLKAIEIKLKTSKFIHEPVAEDGCEACHQPHGSNRFRLLNDAYPERYYAPFKVESYALCFGCHDEEKFTEKSTTEATGFRNGKKNLHFVHVNRKRGRSCRACHDVHAAPYPKQIAHANPYGDWMLPVGFEQTETGGSCATACHARRAYDRDKPIRTRAKKKRK